MSTPQEKSIAMLEAMRIANETNRKLQSQLTQANAKLAMARDTVMFYCKYSKEPGPDKAGETLTALDDEWEVVDMRAWQDPYSRLKWKAAEETHFINTQPAKLLIKKGDV